MNLKLVLPTLLLFNFLVVQGQGNLPKTYSNVRTGVHKTNTNLNPFNWGVASGDPTHESVVIWTKIEGDNVNDASGVYVVALDTGFTQIVKSGTFTTGKQLNYTVKLNVSGLTPDTYYYYHFAAFGKNSLTGRTKTTPLQNTSENQLKFGILSCQNYEHGYFNVLRAFADFNELDAIVHLGDYIYEYKENTNIPGREHDSLEAITLHDYRRRYNLYKTDADLIRIHQQYPFIQIWDDHEVADNAWKDGASNHNPATEGPWSFRKSAGYRAFYEYQPMWPGQDSSVYRSIKYGDLAEWILWDTRLVGREQQIYDVTDSLVYDSNRTILGATQLNWFNNSLNSTNVQWKLIANQVYFSPFHIGWAAVAPQSPQFLESQMLDVWDGYPAERKKILQNIKSNQIENVVIVTGDIHAAFANEVADPVCDTGNGYALLPNYNPTTAAGAQAVEFVTPSVSSDNYDERSSAFLAGLIEMKFNSPLANGNVPNPHTKYLDLDRHGGIVLTIDTGKAQADYYYVDTKLTPSDSMYFDKGAYVINNTHQLHITNNKANGKSFQAIPAPLVPRSETIGISEFKTAAVKVYPNPAINVLKIEWPSRDLFNLSVSIYNISGVEFYSHIFTDFNKEEHMDVSNLPAGVYFMALSSKLETHVRKIEIIK